MRRKSGFGLEKPLGHLPAELDEFLSRDTYSLLIKGASGSGKTTLALTILSRLKTGANTLYLSTRTSPDQLTKDSPWIRKLAGLSTGARTGRPSGDGWETLVDSRLDEPGIVFERITNVLMDNHAPTVVVDSWEALNDSLDSEALQANIRVLQTWRERAGARFIFIGEDPANTAIDSVVDGVVTLTERVVYGRRLREIFLSKLHGVQISSPTYFFSLENGLFRSFERYGGSGFGFGRASSRNAEIRRVDRHRLRTGFRPLDEALGGGYPRKSLAWIEVDPQVDSEVVMAFVSATILEWTAPGSVVLHWPEGIHASKMTRLRAAMGAGGKERLRLWGPVSVGKKGRVDGIAELESKLTEARQPVLCIVDLDNLSDIAVSAGPAALEPLANLLRNGAELSIVISRSRPGQDPLSGIVSTHMKILSIGGTLFTMSEKPWSELFAMVPVGRAGNAAMQLERVV